MVFHPEVLMDKIISFTHYYPDSWRGNLHTHFVKNEFSKLFPYKVLAFLMEITGVLITPFAMIFFLPQLSENFVDFFRDFSVKNDENLGYVCSFATFDFHRFGDPKVFFLFFFSFFFFFFFYYGLID